MTLAEVERWLAPVLNYTPEEVGPGRGVVHARRQEPGGPGSDVLHRRPRGGDRGGDQALRVQLAIVAQAIEVQRRRPVGVFSGSGRDGCAWAGASAFGARSTPRGTRPGVRLRRSRLRSGWWRRRRCAPRRLHGWRAGSRSAGGCRRRARRSCPWGSRSRRRCRAAAAGAKSVRSSAACCRRPCGPARRSRRWPRRSDRPGRRASGASRGNAARTCASGSSWS